MKRYVITILKIAGFVVLYLVVTTPQQPAHGSSIFLPSVVYKPGGTFTNSGNVIVAGAVSYGPQSEACNVFAYSTWIDTGTATFDVWKIATGTALPTVTNTIINGTSYLEISTGTLLRSTTLTSLTTTTIAAHNMFAFKLQAVTGSPTVAHVNLECR